MSLALVRDLREHRVPVSAEELAGFETDVLAGFVLARASAGVADSTIRNDTGHLGLIRDWFGRPLWEMRPADADAYFGKVLRERGRRRGRAGRPRWRCTSSTWSCGTRLRSITSLAGWRSARWMR